LFSDSGIYRKKTGFSFHTRPAFSGIPTKVSIASFSRISGADFTTGGGDVNYIFTVPPSPSTISRQVQTREQIEEELL
jgi:hypothetical protein